MASHGIARPAASVQRTEEQLQEEHRKIQEYRDLEDLIRTKVAERQYTVEVLNLTSKLLKANPEYYTIWNVRRRLLIYGLFSKSSDSSSPSKVSPSTSRIDTTPVSSTQPSDSVTTSSEASNTALPDPSSQNPGKNGTTLDLIKADLEFLFPIMVGWPKCYWLWNYRLWLLQEANKRLDPITARKLWTQELTLVGKMLVRDSRNFHGWRYRRIVVDELESQHLQGTSMVEVEFEYTTKVIRGQDGLSNFSAWHRRSKLIPKLLNERGTDDAGRRQFLDDEFDTIITAMYTDAFPYAQSVWFYYQFLMTTLTDSVRHATITSNFTQEDRIGYLTRQLSILKEMLEDADDCKWIYDALIEYTMSLSQMEQRQLDKDETEDCKLWLSKLRVLDRLRGGRWDDLDKELSGSRALVQ
ncbi:hypothetical protein HYALB_00006968 [Hymenoscyphus albidus]|uniref:Geranylgeranyl transferase type-2 subunit alpha n=1 Tax=Hymenoscyphus albidus TaxID=595503 RepID=A0A9N9Q3S7_9HELO|nr:hypothetical protein HYALB_00006968 [Hymenoscyphus albidus]